MNDTLLSRCAPRANRWMLLAALFSLAMPSFAHAQTEDESEEDAPKKDAGKKPAGGDADADADAAEADAADAEAEAELAAEEARAAGAVTKPPAKGKGGLWGVIKDTKFNEAVIEANVQVVGRKEKALADIEGRFRLDLPPGKYAIRVTYELHRPSRAENIEIAAGKLTRVDVQLTPDESAVEEVVIEEAVDKTTNEGLALTRKQSATVGDGVGRAEIARTPDKNAAEAAQRVVGATVVGGRFVFVRGLGERYTNALLNGAPLPSPEPDRNTVPLDLFPSMVLDSLTIVKQFTPDMPADFAGGSVRIQTRDFPKQPLFQISLNGGYNTEATFRKRPGYYGSSTQWLGYDSGRRQFPEGIPNRRIGTGKIESVEEQVGYGYRFNTLMSTMRKATPPNHGLSIVAGNGYKLGQDKKLGVLLAFSYGRTYQIRDITARKFMLNPLETGGPNAVQVGDDFSGKQGIDTVRWGAFGNASLELQKNHTISLLALRSQTADDLTSETEGQLSGMPATYHTNHLEYVSRDLNFVQLRGELRYPKLSDLQINWHASIAHAGRQQPDTRDTRYLLTEKDGIPGWKNVGSGSGTHTYFDQSDRTLAGGLDILQPIIKSPEHETKLKFGGLLSSRDRSFHARRFQLVRSRDAGELYDEAEFCNGASWSTNCPSQLFRPDLVRADGLLLEEYTFNLDEYKTGLDVYALYGMVDTKLTPNLRAIAGVRSEITYQFFTGFDPFDHNAPARQSQIYQTDWLPGLSVVYATSKDSNARFGLSQTLARPQLREITPTLFTSFSGDQSVQGNEKLQMTKISNVDLRYEFFPTLREVLAVSLFYKKFKNPIEEIVDKTSLNFANADGAYAYGLELEGRKTLNALAPALKQFTAIGNVTLVQSEVQLGYRGAASTNKNRALAYQSPYVVNLALDYDNEKSQTEIRVLYNVLGPRIVASGADGLPDIYERPRHQVDLSVAQKLSKHFELKAQALNILHAPVVFAYRGVQSFKPRVSPEQFAYFESMGRDAVVSRYNPGSTFVLTASYNY